MLINSRMTAYLRLVYVNITTGGKTVTINILDKCNGFLEKQFKHVIINWIELNLTLFANAQKYMQEQTSRIVIDNWHNNNVCPYG